MHLRPCHPGEEPKLWDLYQTLGSSSARSDDDPQQWLARLRGSLPVVVEYGGEVIGYANLLDNGEIGHFYVRETWQGRGIGTLLMQRLHEQARGLGLTLLTARVCQASRSFFSHWGFAVQEQDIEGRQNVLMSKNLS
jgi:putative acetyltransferase